MPWKEQRIVDQRQSFIHCYLRGITSMSELCRQHGVARKTGYKWVRRFLGGGMPALMEPLSIRTKRRYDKPSRRVQNQIRHALHAHRILLGARCTPSVHHREGEDRL